jgi:hypothetical protein
LGGDDDDYVICRGDMAQALIWWQHLGALHKATNMLHRLMSFVPYLLGGMVVKIDIE